MNTERFRAEIDLNARQAQSELKKLEEQQKRLKDQQKALYESSSAKNHQLAADMQKDIDNVSTKIREQKKYINGLSTAVSDLSKASYKELAATARALNKELRSGEIPKESAQFKAMADRIKECRREMNRYNEATREQQSFWGRAADSLNKYQTAIATVTASLTGLTLTIRKCVSDYAEMEDTMADVRKYTGQTDEQVREMNEDFKQMDTRTSREQLNELAGAAGRLGITSKDAIEDFVDAADKINVASVMTSEKEQSTRSVSSQMSSAKIRKRASWCHARNWLGIERTRSGIICKCRIYRRLHCRPRWCRQAGRNDTGADHGTRLRSRSEHAREPRLPRSSVSSSRRCTRILPSSPRLPV